MPEKIFDIEDVLFNPKRYFNHPGEVVNNEILDRDQKIALLLNWEWDIKLEEVAEEENMVANVSDILPEIKAALKTLGVTTDIDHTSSGKFGGV